ncbi:uncharacterized protein LOC120527430 [Polypterus senegalus]|uniref:uncharacterized protein LOC120527430 n=1 Tax=Polypterus senegalus TaxID=55291 RepID=UPI0019645257|nr:uncharacterized protein LOC120527430 [Polypterus senegalus]XP_039606772.1 uncharacterized protein LOC120527430 [Polypterus senegalus]
MSSKKFSSHTSAKLELSDLEESKNIKVGRWKNERIPGPSQQLNPCHSSYSVQYQRYGGNTERKGISYCSPILTARQHVFDYSCTQEMPLLHLHSPQHFPSSCSVFPVPQTASQTIWTRSLPPRLLSSMYFPNTRHTSFPIIRQVSASRHPSFAHNLIPLQKVIAFQQRRLLHSVRQTHFGQWQLLTTGLSSCVKGIRDCTSKREKRKKKLESAYRQVEERLHIPLQTDDSPVFFKKNIQCDQPVCGLEDILSNSAENFDSVLIDQSISSLSSTADFHYYASTHKWPANTRETGTNTVDLAVLQPKSTTVLSGDDVEHRLLFNADDSARCLQSPLTVPVAQKYFASKLAEMDAQLTTLQNISENMELEFYNTRLFVDTAEKLNKQQHYVNQKYLGTGILAKKKDFKIRSKPQMLTKNSLQPQKLRNIYNILNDLETESTFPASELDLPQKQTRQVKRICHLYQGVSKSRHQREEIREWMKRKYKQRQAEYRRQLDEKRKNEHHPFTPTANVSTEDIKINNIIKGVKDKIVSAEHHSHRKMEAVKLMKEIVSDAMQLTTYTQNSVTSKSRRFVQSPKRRAARRRH